MPYKPPEYKQVHDVVRLESRHGYVEIRRERHPAGVFLGHFHTWSQTGVEAMYHNTGELAVNNLRRLKQQLTELAARAGFSTEDEDRERFVDTLVQAINVLQEIYARTCLTDEEIEE